MRLLKEAYGAGGLDPEVVSAAQRKHRAEFEADLRRQWEQEREAAEAAAAVEAAAADAAAAEAAAAEAAAAEAAAAQVEAAEAVAAEAARFEALTSAAEGAIAGVDDANAAGLTVPRNALPVDLLPDDAEIESESSAESDGSVTADDEQLEFTPRSVPGEPQRRGDDPRVLHRAEAEAVTERDTQSPGDAEEWSDDSGSDGGDILSDLDEPVYFGADVADDVSVSSAGDEEGANLRRVCALLLCGLRTLSPPTWTCASQTCTTQPRAARCA